MSAKILVIEDNLEVRENLVELLELDGFDVSAAPNGKHGVQMAIEILPDLILCDVMMPELDGYGVLKILGRNTLTNKIPFIYLTAKSEKIDFRKGMTLGADDYITKPFDDTELLEIIQVRLQKNDRLLENSNKSLEGINGFFSEVSAQNDLLELTKEREIRQLNAKEYLFREGDTPRWLYFLAEGKIKIIQVNEFGKELTTQTVNPNTFFGHKSLFLEKPYLTSAIALEESKIVHVPKKDFVAIINSNANIGAHFIKLISNESENTEKLLIELAYSSVRRKVAIALLSLLPDDNAQPHIVTSNRENLASLAGIAKETLIRTLSDFKTEGLVSIDKEKITIHKLKELKDMPQ